MRRNAKRSLVPFFLVLSLLPSVPFAEPAYQSGTLLGIEKKVKTTPLTYVFEVVVSYYETVTYELQIQVGHEVYYTDYTPDVQPNGPLPTEWKPNQTIQFRTDKHRLFVKLSYGGEIETFIARRERPRRP
jgi:hypothetical protein